MTKKKTTELINLANKKLKEQIDEGSMNAIKFVLENLDTTHHKLADKLVLENVRNAENLSLVIKYSIEKSLKIKFLSKLEEMNISADYLFPGLDGLGKRSYDLCIQKINES